MSEAQDCNELHHRRVWLDSTEFKEDMEACERGGLNDELRKESNIHYAMEYYRQPVQKGWISFGLLFLLPVVLHIIGACTSDTFLKSVQQGDIAALAFIVLGAFFTYFSLWYQREDRHRPCLRVKIIHTASSLVGAGLNVALAAYLRADKEKLDSDPPATISVLAMALASPFVHVGSLQLLLKGVSGNLDKTEWADLLRLVRCSIPPENVAWQSLPDQERAWVESKRAEYLTRRCQELNSTASAPAPTPIPNPSLPAPPHLPPAIASGRATPEGSSGAPSRRSSRPRRRTELYGRP
ncbi:hypothetical protein EMPG_10281 [Blastomyces silverae]|uniref:Uncharacterized protein n=1 Tax=Blastomyces silverae TaxID=2060906 RepID=A0A0H1B5R3_9EURO|nr:hypothetical protein EMPG_10281 [Blastomyces silverae]